MMGSVTRRLAAMIGVLFAISVITFAIFVVIPGGDPAVRLAGRAPTQQNIENIRAAWGLDKPLPVQYVRMMRQLGDGSLTSYVQHTSVRSELIHRFPATFWLTVGATLIWIVLGMTFGTLAAIWHGTWRDRLLGALALAGLSVPGFWAAIELRDLVSAGHHWLPAGGYVPLFDDPVQWFLHLLLPCFVMSIGFIAICSRLLRNTILDVVGEDYIRTARAKGLTPWRIWRDHVLRNALTPVVNLLGLEFAAVLAGGTVFVETIFDIHGLGEYAASAVASLDLPPLMGVTLYGAAVVVIASAIFDVFSGWLDPRTRTAR
jgi:peptide/nickel transport system permease protein